MVPEAFDRVTDHENVGVLSDDDIRHSGQKTVKTMKSLMMGILRITNLTSCVFTSGEVQRHRINVLPFRDHVTLSHLGRGPYRLGIDRSGAAALSTELEFDGNLNLYPHYPQVSSPAKSHTRYV